VLRNAFGEHFVQKDKHHGVILSEAKDLHFFPVNITNSRKSATDFVKKTGKTFLISSINGANRHEFDRDIYIFRKYIENV